MSFPIKFYLPVVLGCQGNILTCRTNKLHLETDMITKKQRIPHMKIDHIHERNRTQLQKAIKYTHSVTPLLRVSVMIIAHCEWQNSQPSHFCVQKCM
jgi:hypothetical protein